MNSPKTTKKKIYPREKKKFIRAIAKEYRKISGRRPDGMRKPGPDSALGFEGELLMAFGHFKRWVFSKKKNWNCWILSRK